MTFGAGGLVGVRASSSGDQVVVREVITREVVISGEEVDLPESGETSNSTEGQVAVSPESTSTTVPQTSLPDLTSTTSTSEPGGNGVSGCETDSVWFEPYIAGYGNPRYNPSTRSFEVEITGQVVLRWTGGLRDLNYGECHRRGWFHASDAASFGFEPPNSADGLKSISVSSDEAVCSPDWNHDSTYASPALWVVRNISCSFGGSARTGPKTVRVIVTDFKGAEYQYSMSWNVDLLAPSIVVTSWESEGLTPGIEYSINYSASDDTAVSSIEVEGHDCKVHLRLAGWDPLPASLNSTITCIWAGNETAFRLVATDESTGEVYGGNRGWSAEYPLSFISEEEQPVSDGEPPEDAG